MKESDPQARMTASSLAFFCAHSSAEMTFADSVMSVMPRL